MDDVIILLVCDLGLSLPADKGYVETANIGLKLFYWDIGRHLNNQLRIELHVLCRRVVDDAVTGRENVCQLEVVSVERVTSRSEIHRIHELRARALPCKNQTVYKCLVASSIVLIVKVDPKLSRKMVVVFTIWEKWLKPRRNCFSVALVW